MGSIRVHQFDSAENLAAFGRGEIQFFAFGLVNDCHVESGDLRPFQGLVFGALDAFELVAADSDRLRALALQAAREGIAAEVVLPAEEFAVGVETQGKPTTLRVDGEGELPVV